MVGGPGVEFGGFEFPFRREDGRGLLGAVPGISGGVGWVFDDVDALSRHVTLGQEE